MKDLFTVKGRVYSRRQPAGLTCRDCAFEIINQELDPVERDLRNTGCAMIGFNCGVKGQFVEELGLIVVKGTMYEVVKTDETGCAGCVLDFHPLPAGSVARDTMLDLCKEGIRCCSTAPCQILRKVVD